MKLKLTYPRFDAEAHSLGLTPQRGWVLRWLVRLPLLVFAIAGSTLAPLVVLGGTVQLALHIGIASVTGVLVVSLASLLVILFAVGLWAGINRCARCWRKREIDVETVALCSGIAISIIVCVVLIVNELPG